MLGFLIGLLTVVMVLDCVVLILLVLIQLPKKEAGAGLAFGGSATDALFGAGTGNVLTKVTKYAAGVFLVGAIVLSVLQSRSHSGSTSAFESKLQQPASLPLGQPSPAPAPASTPATKGALVSTNLMSAPLAEATNAPVPPAPPAATPAVPVTNVPAPR
jgi:preprotein translocase subunit SecG